MYSDSDSLVNDAVDPIRVDLDYWTNLRETCERNRESVRTREGDDSENDKSEVKLEFIREQLVEMTQLIDNRIESVFKIAQEEESDTTAHLLTSEFLAQLIEICDDLSWLIIRIPEELTGKRLYKQYFTGFEEVIKTLLGMERIWWSIRRGYSGIPRNRDYSTAHLFANLKSDAIEYVRDQFDSWITELNESITVLKRSDKISNSTRIVFCTFNIIKKIRLNNAFVTQNHCIDEILDASESLIFNLKDLLSSLLTSSDANSTKLLLLNRQLYKLIGFLQLDEGVDGDGDVWFKNHLKEIDEICEEIEEMNPNR